MGKFQDLTGKQFGKLTVVKRAANKGTTATWECKCECGNVVIKTTSALNSGHAVSCGCSRHVNDIAVGQKFGRLTAIERIGTSQNHKALWRCRCDCGNEVVVIAGDIKSGRTQSCGCYHKDRNIQTSTIHGKSKLRVYQIWIDMINRCYNPKIKNYKNYGARGITVCAEWKSSLECFLKWAFSHGYSEDLTIDRIDVNGNYEPSNCRWATTIEQGRNKRNNRRITHNGRTQTATDWAEELNIPRSRIFNRIDNLGWPPEKAIVYCGNGG